jgi:hypothetical protein
VIPAKVSEDVVPDLGQFYTHLVQAEVIVTTVRSQATGTEHHSYLVVGLSRLPEDR